MPELPLYVDPQIVKSTEDETSAKVRWAEAFQVSTTETMQEAEKFARGCRLLEREIGDRLKPAKDSAHAAHKAVCDLEKELQKNAIKARSIIEPKISAFREAEQLRRANEAEEKRKKDEEDRLAAASRAESSGNAALADRIISEEVAPVVPEKIEKTAGVRTQTDWKYEIADPEAIPRQFLSPDEKKIGAYVRAFKDEAKIAGVRVYSETRPVYTK